MALGGQSWSILKLVVAHSLKLALLGVAIGLAGSYAVTRIMTSILVGVRPTDTLTFAAVALALTAVAVLASYLPARRAARAGSGQGLTKRLTLHSRGDSAIYSRNNVARLMAE
jgi:ABC-type antimicrobial peptide transport system permease subunit